MAQDGFLATARQGVYTNASVSAKGHLAALYQESTTILAHRMNPRRRTPALRSTAASIERDTRRVEEHPAEPHTRT